MAIDSKRILLGQSMNQAVNILGQDFDEEKYKTLVRQLNKINSDLQEELLGDQSSPSTYSKPTSKTKPCPNCQEMIPSGFMFHVKCGWKGNK